ncbi:MAG: TRAP transporter small permease [Burkholderiales bacterium]|jgi:TRAP-type C4-dicarboxylate transport system permease small subunit
MHAALMRGCGYLAAATVALITLLVCYDVVGRNLGLPSLVWVNEITEYALPIATLAAAPWLMWRNQHVRLDLLGAVLSTSSQRRVDRVASLLGLVISLVMVWYAVRMLLDSRQAGSLVMKALVFPEWWLYVPVPIGFALLALECGRRVLRPSGLTEEAVLR